MLGSGTLLDALLVDPLALYPALAALLLASVSLASGLLRGDVLALARPLPAAWVVLAVAGCWGLQRALTNLAPAGWEVAPTVALAPLALIALAYGPTPALVALALAAAWVGLPEAQQGADGDARLWLQGLELVVLGWLAIAPSPRRWPLVAGAYLLLAHVLTWATAGIAWVVVVSSDLTLETMRDQHGFGFVGLAVFGLLLASLPPSWWRSLFPGSSIMPPVPTRAPATARHVAREATAPGAEPAAGLAPWARQRDRRGATPLAPIEAPPPFTRPPRSRRRLLQASGRRR